MNTTELDCMMMLDMAERASANGSLVNLPPAAIRGIVEDIREYAGVLDALVDLQEVADEEWAESNAWCDKHPYQAGILGRIGRWFRF